MAVCISLPDELINARLDRALTPVDGGYSIVSGYDGYDFSMGMVKEVVGSSTYAHRTL